MDKVGPAILPWLHDYSLKDLEERVQWPWRRFAEWADTRLPPPLPERNNTDPCLTRKTYTHLRVVDTAAAVEQLPELDSPAAEADRAVRTGTDDRPIVSGLGKVLTKSTTPPVFLGHSVAQTGMEKAPNGDLSDMAKLSENGQEMALSGTSSDTPKSMGPVGPEPTTNRL